MFVEKPLLHRERKPGALIQQHPGQNARDLTPRCRFPETAFLKYPAFKTELLLLIPQNARKFKNFPQAKCRINSFEHFDLLARKTPVKSLIKTHPAP
jgi:hypothetical protein